MKKITKILIVEDEMIIAANISLQLTNIGYEVTGIINKGEEVLKHIEQNSPDIILMDINLKGDLDGIEIAHLVQISYKIPIVFLTANNDDYHFTKAKIVNPYGFVSKPFKKIDLQRTLELAVLRIEEEQKLYTRNSKTEEKPFILNDSIFVRSTDKMIKVMLDDILYIEADRNYSKIFTLQKEFVIVATLKDLEDKLHQYTFLRIHRSFIVNLKHIDQIATNHVVVKYKEIPLNPESKKHLMQHIQKV